MQRSNQAENLNLLLALREHYIQRRRTLQEKSESNQRDFDNEENTFRQLLHQFILLRTEIRTLVFRDIYYYIRRGNPSLMQARRVARPRTRFYLSHQYWLITHPNLTDDNGPNSFKGHYRMNKTTFENLVNLVAKDSRFLGSQTSGGTPIYIQVACALWRFANCHFGFRIAKVHRNVTAGSYNNFTDRFIDAMASPEARNHCLHWPDTPERVESTIEGFKSFAGMDGCIGAIDGKLVVIQKPSVNGTQWIDRKNHASMSMMAVCDHRLRYTALRVGHSGKFDTYLLHLSNLLNFTNNS